jgi:integrase
MKTTRLPPSTIPVTLETVIDRLASNDALSDVRKRDLRSAVRTLAKLQEKLPGDILLDLANIRTTLDGIVPAQAKVSRKRLANLRSDLAAAIEASGLRPMFRTAKVELDEGWAQLLAPADQRVRHGLSRFARWASLRGVAPERVDDGTIGRFIAELDAATLVRNLPGLHRIVARGWNALARLEEGAGLRPVSVPPSRFMSTRTPWHQFLVSLREDTERHRAWASVPDPLAEGARDKALAPLSLRLQQTHIHSAASAAVAAGIPLDQITSLASLVEPETFRALLSHLLRKDGGKLSAFTHGVAVTLVAIASEWVKASPDHIAKLKKLRGKLGTLPPGLTPKNQALLRKFDDPQMLEALIDLPDKLWRAARRNLATSRWPFIDLQNALAIDLLLHFAPRMQNLCSLRFDKHLHWPQGRRNPALLTFSDDETKNDISIGREIPTFLAERLQVYRNEICPAVIGKRPDAVFVTFSGKPRTQAAIKIAIEKTVLKHLGVKITPHQFRHLYAQAVLDANPGAHLSVQEGLGHKNLKTTINFYAGINTRRAGRAHAELLQKIRESKLGRGRQRRIPRPREE